MLFCKDPRVNQESAADELLSCVQRAFKNVDREQCGFIAAEALEAVLLELDLLPSADPTFLPRCAERCHPSLVKGYASV